MVLLEFRVMYAGLHDTFFLFQTQTVVQKHLIRSRKWVELVSNSSVAAFEVKRCKHCMMFRFL